MKAKSNKKFTNKNFLLNKVDEKRSKFAYIFLFFSFFALAFWLSRELIPNTEIFGINIKHLFDINHNGINPIIWNGLRGGNFLFYLFIISFFELSNRNLQFGKASFLNNLSLFRIRFSEGAKFADLYYFLIQFGLMGWEDIGRIGL